MSKVRPAGDVAILGAGVAGMVLALAFRQRGFTPRVFEARTRENLINEGAFLTLAPNACTVSPPLAFRKA